MIKQFLKSTGFIAAYLGIYFALQTIFIIIITTVIAVQNLLKSQRPPSPEYLQNQILGYAIPSIIFATIVAFPIFLAICKGRKQSIFKESNFTKLKHTMMVLLIPGGIALSLSTSFLMTIIEKSGFFSEAFTKYEEFATTLIGGNLLITIIGVGIFAPFIEEVIFRGLILSELKRHMKIAPAIIIQAVLFGLYHMQPVQGAYAIFIGILLGLACVWLDSIWASIILHILINTTSVTISELVTSDVSDNIFNGISVVCIGVVICVFVLFYKKRKQVVLPDSDGNMTIRV